MKSTILAATLALLLSISASAQVSQVSVEISRTPSQSSSTNAFELGAKIATWTPGRIIALKFLKLPGDPGPHVGHVWSSTGTLLATVPFLTETVSGWQTQALMPGLRITPGPYVVVSVNSVPGQHFPLVPNGFASAFVKGNLSAPPNGGASGPPGIFPTTTSPHDYFRDIVFEPEPLIAGITLNPVVLTPIGLSIAGAVTGLPAGTYTVLLSVADGSGRLVTSPPVLVTVP